MTLKKAHKIIIEYQKWRRGAEIPMPSAKEFGIAIDTILKYMQGETK